MAVSAFLSARLYLLGPGRQGPRKRRWSSVRTISTIVFNLNNRSLVMTIAAGGGSPQSDAPCHTATFPPCGRLTSSGRLTRAPSRLEVVVDSSGNTIIGVIIGAILVIAVLFWAFGGFNRSEPDLTIDLPNVEINPPGPPAPGP
jgi:hypothetical protein